MTITDEMVERAAQPDEIADLVERLEIWLRLHDWAAKAPAVEPLMKESIDRLRALAQEHTRLQDWSRLLDRDVATLTRRIRELEAERDAIQALNKSLLAHNGELIRELGAERDAIWAKTIEECAVERDALIGRLKSRIDIRLNNCLCEMKPDYDDSITGFNEAWDIVRAVFKDEEKLHDAIRALAQTDETNASAD